MSAVAEFTPGPEDGTGAVQQFFTARCAQDAKHAKKDIMTAGYRRSQQLAPIFLPVRAWFFFRSSVPIWK